MRAKSRKVNINLVKSLGVKSIYTIASSLLLTGFFVVFGVIAVMVLTISNKGAVLEKHYVGLSRYSIIDNFFDPADFSNFRNNAKSVESTGVFYNALIESEKVEFLSVFNQPIELTSFAGPDEFLYSTEEFRLANPLASKTVKALQINDNAFQYYSLKVQEGRSFDWHTIHYDSASIPVLLGSFYKDSFDVGSKIDGSLYNRAYTFEVLGFLIDNASIFFKTSAEFYLDDYIVIPYPTHCWEIVSDDFFFEGILYFAMINSDLVTSLDEQSFIDEIKRASDISGFSDFSVVGINDFAIKYQSLLQMIYSNKQALALLSMLISTLILGILVVFGRTLLLSKKSKYMLLFLFGDTRVAKVLLIELLVPYIFSVPVSVALVSIFIGFYHPLIPAMICCVDILAFSVVFLCCYRLLRRMHYDSGTVLI